MAEFSGVPAHERVIVGNGRTISRNYDIENRVDFKDCIASAELTPQKGQCYQVFANVILETCNIYVVASKKEHQYIGQRPLKKQYTLASSDEI